jgi:hypothetical protein
VIDTLALLGVLSDDPPLGLDSATSNDLLPENGVESMMLTEKPFEVASPSAHSSVPLAAVYSLPAIAVPLLVA